MDLKEARGIADEAVEVLFGQPVEKNRAAVLIIKLDEMIIPESLEKLEDDIRDLLNSKGIRAAIEDDGTGNTTVAEG